MAETTSTMLQTYLGMLNSTSVVTKGYWLDVGRALYDIHQGLPKGLREWQQFCECYPAIADKCTPEVYASFEGSYITFKTIQWYARQDSLTEYTTRLRAKLVPHMDQLPIEGYTVLIPMLIIIYELDIVVCDEVWYRFTDQNWVQIDEPSLIDYIKKDFAVLINSLGLINKDVDISLKPNYTNIITNTLKGVKPLLQKAGFKERLNSQSRLVAFTNGICESSEGKTLFRPGKPEDYCLGTTGLKYMDMLSIESLKPKTSSFGGKDFSSLTASLFDKAFSSKKKSASPREETKNVAVTTPVGPQKSPRSRAQVFSFDGGANVPHTQTPPLTPRRQRRASLGEGTTSS